MIPRGPRPEVQPTLSWGPPTWQVTRRRSTSGVYPGTTTGHQTPPTVKPWNPDSSTLRSESASCSPTTIDSDSERLAASPLAALNRGWSCVLKTTSVPESRPVTTVRRPPGSTDLTVPLSSSSRKISETAVCSPTITGVPGPGSVGASAAAQFPRVVATSGTENRISWSVPSVVPISVLAAGSKDLIVLTMSADGSTVKAKVRGRWNRIDISPRRKPRSARATHPIADWSADGPQPSQEKTLGGRPSRGWSRKKQTPTSRKASPVGVISCWKL